MTMDQITLDLNKVVNYEAARNCCRGGPGYPVFKYGVAQAIDDLKNHFKKVAEGTAGWPN